MFYSLVSEFKENVWSSGKKCIFFPSVCTCWKKKKRSRQGALIQGDNTMKYGSISLSLAHMHPQTHVFTVCNAHNLFFPPCSYKCCSVPSMCFSSLTTDISLLSSDLLKVMFNTSLMFCQLAPAFLYELLGSLMNIKHWFIGENGGWSHYAIMQIAHRHYLLHW